MRALAGGGNYSQVNSIARMLSLANCQAHPTELLMTEREKEPVVV